MKLRSLVFPFTSLCLLILTSTRISAQAKPYPSEVVKNYIETCTASRGPEVEAICSCTIRKIQDVYTLEEYQTINSQLQKTGKLPPALIIILNACQDDPNS